MNLFFDLETIPADPALKRTVIDLAKKRVVKEDLENQESKAKKFNAESIYRLTALSGDFGRIFCIAYALGDQNVEVINGDEKDILIKWWKITEEATCFVGHNIYEFDLPFLFKRSIVHKIKPASKHLDLSFARYRSYPIYDTMREWDKWSMRASISLDKLAKVLGLPSSKDGGIEGSQVYDAYLAKRFDEIYQYCKRDVELTRKVYRRMVFED